MKTFADKVKETRMSLRLTQQDLADQVGVSKRTIAGYEIGEKKPRDYHLRKLAEALQVSVDYLRFDTIDDPLYGMEKQPYIETTRERFGNKAAKEIDYLMERNTALFAGGDISEEAKDAYFEAVMKAYLACKDEARKTFGRKKKEELE